MSTVRTSKSATIPPVDIRKAIIGELEHQGRSKYWLAKLMEERGVCTEQYVYRYLRGGADTSGTIIGEMLDALGLKLSHKS